MKNVLVLGGGKVGKSVAEMLLGCGRGEYRVTLADRDAPNLREAETNLRRLGTIVPHRADFAVKQLDAGDKQAVRDAMKGHDYCICMLPYNFVGGIAEAACEVGLHYFDVTEDVECADQIKALDNGGKAKVALVPQCGLAPGYISIAAYEVTREFTVLHDLMLRVGALPQFPTNAPKYNITWSAAGVVNEYCEPCNAMLDGRVIKAPALEGLESFSFEGIEYEAFYTSGGVGTLIETMVGEKKTCDESRIAYKTIRYPGHRDLMKFLLHDLRLNVEHGEPTKSGRVFDRQLAIELLDHAVARTLQDVVVVFINAIGIKDGRREQVNFRRSIHATKMFGRVWPAIELTTAAGVCGMIELHRTGKVRQKGLIRQEEVPLAMFNQTIFGLAYEAPEKMEAASVSR